MAHAFRGSPSRQGIFELCALVFAVVVLFPASIAAADDLPHVDEAVADVEVKLVDEVTVDPEGTSAGMAPTHVVEPLDEVKSDSLVEASVQPAGSAMRKLTSASVNDTVHPGVSLEAHLTSLQHARRIGLNSTKVASLETEAKKLALEFLTLVTQDLSDDSDDFAVDMSRAIDFANRAGVPQEKIDQTWTTVRGTLHATLLDSVATIARNFTGPALTKLSDAIFLWRKLGFPEEDPDHVNATALIANISNTAIQTGDLELSALILQCTRSMTSRSTEIPIRWLSLYEVIRTTYPHLESEPLRNLLQIVIGATMSGLPLTNALNMIRTAAQNRSIEALQNISGESIHEILELIQDARTIDVSPDAAAYITAAATARNLASTQLQDAVAGPLNEDTVDTISNAFQDALLADVNSSEVDAKRTQLYSTVQPQLINATARLAANRTVAHMREVASWLYVWKSLRSVLPPNVDTAVREQAEEVFQAQLESAIEGNVSTDVLEGAALLGLTGVQCCSRALQWSDVAETLGGILAEIRSSGDVALDSALQVLTQAKAVHYPAISDIAEVEAHLSSMVTTELDQELADANPSMATLVKALENTQRIQSINTTTAQVNARNMVLSHLNQTVVVDAQTVTDPTLVSDAFDYARRVGLSTTQTDEAWTALKIALQTRLTRASRAADFTANFTVNSNTTLVASTMQDLAEAMHMWKKLQMPPDSDEIIFATEVFERHLVDGWAARNAAFIVPAISWAATSKGSFEIIEEMAPWANIHSELESACSSGLENHAIENLLTLRDEVDSVGMLGSTYGTLLRDFLINGIQTEVDGYATG